MVDIHRIPLCRCFWNRYILRKNWNGQILTWINTETYLSSITIPFTKRGINPIIQAIAKIECTTVGRWAENKMIGRALRISIQRWWSAVVATIAMLGSWHNDRRAEKGRQQDWQWHSMQLGWQIFWIIIRLYICSLQHRLSYIRIHQETNQYPSNTIFKIESVCRGISWFKAFISRSTIYISDMKDKSGIRKTG